MKKLLFILMIAALVLTMGCEPPKPPNPPVVTEGIVCAGGNYSVQYQEWTQTGCENSTIQAGTFWENANGRIFYLGVPVTFDSTWNSTVAIEKVYGKCPTTYIKEIVMKEEYLEEVSKSIK